MTETQTLATPASSAGELERHDVRLYKIEPARGDLFAVMTEQGQTWLIRVEKTLHHYSKHQEHDQRGNLGCPASIWLDEDGSPRQVSLRRSKQRVDCRFFGHPPT